jgi:hypothetical protein
MSIYLHSGMLKIPGISLDNSCLLIPRGQNTFAYQWEKRARVDEWSPVLRILVRKSEPRTGLAFIADWCGKLIVDIDTAGPWEKYRSQSMWSVLPGYHATPQGVLSWQCWQVSPTCLGWQKPRRPCGLVWFHREQNDFDQPERLWRSGVWFFGHVAQEGTDGESSTFISPVLMPVTSVVDQSGRAHLQYREK